MNIIKKYNSKVQEKIDEAINVGDIFHAYEIKGNRVFGTVMFVLLCLHVFILFINRTGVTVADPRIIRLSVLIAIGIDITLITLNKVFYSEKKWLKWVMEIGLTIMCSMFLVMFGPNITLVMMFPIIISMVYYDKKFTTLFAWLTGILCVLAAIGNAYIGLFNLNVYQVPVGTTLYVEDTLRNAVLNTVEIDRLAYLGKLLVTECLVKILFFAPLAGICVMIAKRGREMIELQSKVSRIETELNLATNIQTSMLPKVFPAFPKHDGLELYATNIPAKEVGGDFYDYFEIDDDHVAIVMADVAGKGVGAALFMAIGKAVLKNNLMLSKDPAEAMTRTNAQLVENNSSFVFITTWAGIYEISTNTLTYTNAGHNPPVIMRKDGSLEELKGKDGPVIAIMEGIQYKKREVKIEKGDEIFLYTDGLAEASNLKGEFYGETEMMDAIDSVKKKGVKEQVDLLFAAVTKYAEGKEQFDDITMLGLKIK